MQSIPEEALPRQTDPDAGTDSRLPPGSNFCRCPECGAQFLNVAAFDRHSVGPPADRACMATPQLSDGRFERGPRGYWRLPKREFSGLAA